MQEMTTWLSEFLQKEVIYVDESEADFSKRLQAMGYTDMQIHKQLETFRLWRAGKFSYIDKDFSQYIEAEQTSFKQFIQREREQIKEWAKE